MKKLKWISINKKLPKEKQYVLVKIKYSNKQYQEKICWYQKGLFIDNEQNVWNKKDEELIEWAPYSLKNNEV